MKFMVDESKLFEILDILKNNFDTSDVQGYQQLLFIIYNSLFLDNEVPQSTKYKIFSVLDYLFSNVLNENQKREKNRENQREKEQYFRDTGDIPKSEKEVPQSLVNALYELALGWRIRHNELNFDHVLS